MSVRSLQLDALAPIDERNEDDGYHTPRMQQAPLVCPPAPRRAVAPRTHGWLPHALAFATATTPMNVDG